ncbi:hypothetical protein DASC09_042620 [Saccharomycopsis crataegensis]|uniref:Uncharacterized protein n=1 Tax=Saccharomycopsis crataegensis TaxID=43959 RepID=A0AAV5QR50_9ASCO|nr:hypothetical protein DASC09_042620 [Saccharomycopsis crataegensis]
MPGSPFNNEDMPFYLLAVFLAPATIYFKNGNKYRDVQLWMNFLLFFPVIFSFFGHFIAICHAWYFIYHHSAITGSETGSYLDRLQFNNDDDIESFDGPDVQAAVPNAYNANNEAGASSAGHAVPSYSDAISNGKQPVGFSDNKSQV